MLAHDSVDAQLSWFPRVLKSLRSDSIKFTKIIALIVLEFIWKSLRVLENYFGCFTAT